MTPTEDELARPLTAEEEAMYREGLRDLPDLASGEFVSMVEITRREWMYRCLRLLATLDVARADTAGTPDYGATWCSACGHERRSHSSGGMCDGDGTECYCVRFPDAPDFASPVADTAGIDAEALAEAAGDVEYGDLPRLSAAATPGPWELLTSSDWGNAGLRVPGSTQTFGVGSGQVIGEGLICGPYMDFHGEASNFGANAEFIVAAVNAVRSALAAALRTPKPEGEPQ